MTLNKAVYRGLSCVVREVTDPAGENVVTARGNVYARSGDYVALGVDVAPRGFRSTVIDRVVRRGDPHLTVGEVYIPAPPPSNKDEIMPETLSDEFGTEE